MAEIEGGVTPDQRGLNLGVRRRVRINFNFYRNFLLFPICQAKFEG
jgi:hypothetical protein